MRAISAAFVGVSLIAGAYPAVKRHLSSARIGDRIDRAARVTGPLACSPGTPLPTHAAAAGPMLASWQTIGGCGAGASTGTGAGVKWIGRNVTGGLFQVQCQTNYVHMNDGYMYAVSTLVNRDLGEKWNLGVAVPWLYKYWTNPFNLGMDLSNEGIGDLNVLLTRRLGTVNATSVTASLGIPTGIHDAIYLGPNGKRDRPDDPFGDDTSPLRQDKQLGLGKFTGSLIVDHTFDKLWGMVVVGGSLDYRGGENELKSYRAPGASLYSYVSYLLGPFAPAVGLTVTGLTGVDRDQERVQETPLLTFSGTVSVEWATPYLAVLAGASLPVDYQGAIQPWIVALGISVSPF